ncbi:MAG: hypothetical protein JWO80_3065 [Bryobacterales bacterium]|nr:hypothetical protein [Bryobacterales bacterium]
MTSELVDRRQLGELFGVSSSRAARLVREMGPMPHGNSLVVDAEDIRKLSEVERDREILDLRREFVERHAEIEQGPPDFPRVGRLGWYQRIKISRGDKEVR